MAFLSSLNIPLSGLTAERFRMDIIAQNITNANDVATTPDRSEEHTSELQSQR